MRGASVPVAFVAMAASPTVLIGVAGERPVCQIAEALVGSVDVHLQEWEAQVAMAMSDSVNCSVYLEYVYSSRDQIREQLEYARGNFTLEDERYKIRGEEGGSTTWAVTHASTAASLLSAHLHIHGALGGLRHECLSEHLQLLNLMSLRRTKGLLHSQLRQLWAIFQGTPELFRQGASKWLAELVELFEADIRTFESIMVNYRPDLGPEAALKVPGAVPAAPGRPARPGPPLPPYTPREHDGVGFSTVEVLRKETFDEWESRKPLLRALLRHVVPRDAHVADLCAGGGQTASFLNDTGLVHAYAFDPSPNIKLVSNGKVDFGALHVEGFRLWRQFDVVLCLSASTLYGRETATWAQVWRNVDPYAVHGVIVTCGSEESQMQVIYAAAAYAPSLQYDAPLSQLLSKDEKITERICVFVRNAVPQ